MLPFFFMYMSKMLQKFRYIYMKVEINVPNDLKEIQLHQYQKFLKLQEKSVDEKFLASKMIEVFCGLKLTDALKMKVADVYAITGILGDMFNQKPKLVRKFKMNGVEYGFIPDLDQMSLGEYIDLDSYLGDWENIHRAMNVLYRPIKHKYGEKYNIEEYNIDHPEKMQNMPMDAVLSSVLFFLSFRDRLVESYDELFGGQTGNQFSAISQFGTKWGWYQSIYGLAQGDIRRFKDITKLKMHECFLMLSFMKDKAEAEAKQFKSKLK